MTLEEYELLEKDFLTSSTDIRTFLEAKGLSPHKYYYWKRRSRELKETSSIAEGEFLPIDVHSGGLIKPSRRGKSTSVTGIKKCSKNGNGSAVEMATIIQ